MITENDIYWLTRMDGIKGAVAAIAFLLGLASSFAIFWALMLYDNHPGEWTTPGYKERATAKLALAPRVLFFGILFLCLATCFDVGGVFVPTTREMAAIKVIPLIANNEELKGLGSDVVGLAREWVQELKPKKQAEKSQ